MRSQAEKLKAIAALGLGLGVIGLGVAFAIVSPRSPGGAAAVTPSPSTPSTAAATSLPFAFEGSWELDFAASGLVAPTSSSLGLVMGSSLRLDRGQARYDSGYMGGCDDRTGTFESDGVAFTLRLGPGHSDGCHEAAVDEVVARLAGAVSLSLAPCPPGYRWLSGEPAPTDGSCRQLWLQDKTGQTTLVYDALP